MKDLKLEIKPFERCYLRKFFNDNYDWFINHLDPTIDDLVELITLLEEFIIKENLIYNFVFQNFLQDLKNEVLDFHKSSYRKFVIKAINPPKDLKYIQNSAIAKWYLECRMERYNFNHQVNSFVLTKKRSI